MDVRGVTQVLGAFPDSESDAADAPLPLYLIVVSGAIPGAMLRLAPEATRLGRSPENTYQLADPSISRQHAMLLTDQNGGVWLTDLSSTNGTFLNGRRLTGHTPVRLKDGDRVQLGSSVVVKFVRLDPCEEQFQREMFERTVRDGLTKLYNRSFFLNQIGPLAELGALRGLGIAVLMLDIDHFKSINDTYGHDAGDSVLREVACVLRESTRTEDLVARFGGEEFILALPVAAPEQAAERGERIRAHLDARRVLIDRTTVHVTASLGLAFAPPGTLRAPESLIKAADDCLYQAKNTGRNRLVVRPVPSPREDAPATCELHAAIGN